MKCQPVPWQYVSAEAWGCTEPADTKKCAISHTQNGKPDNEHQILEWLTALSFRRKEHYLGCESHGEGLESNRKQERGLIVDFHAHSTAFYCIHRHSVSTDFPPSKCYVKCLGELGEKDIISTFELHKTIEGCKQNSGTLCKQLSQLKHSYRHHIFWSTKFIPQETTS